MMDTEQKDYREQRLSNMKKLAEMGHKPFGAAFGRSARLADISAAFEEKKVVSAAGRLVTIRDMGKSIFGHIADGTAKFQIYARKDRLGDDQFAAFKLLDLGDHVGVEGALFTTKTGEHTLDVTKWTLLSKALLPLPEKWHGLKDVELKYRMRYLDLVANPETRDLFNKRIRAIQSIRNYLFERGFSEVETPMMQPQPGGAAARPFVTHYTALNTNMYLRIAPELYLKRLLVGGFDKIFEINRSFRNEGLSRTHNTEFTMLEIYEAYSDVRGMKEIVQNLVHKVAQEVFGTLQVKDEEGVIDLTPPWREVAYRDLICAKMGADWYELPVAQAAEKARSLGLTIEPGWTMCQITHEVYEKAIERSLRQPTFVLRLPAEIVPLAKACDDDPDSVDVFELVIRGTEIAPGYSELNDPIEQRRRMEAQAGEEAEKTDEDFLHALEYGMPPAGGMGIGIDRLIMVLSGADSIRDVILFPQLKPKT